MFIISRLNLLFSSLILLKIIKALLKGFSSIVLKVCNKIEISLNSENSHFLQNVRQSGMDSFHNPHLSSTRSGFSDRVDLNNQSSLDDLEIYNLPIGRKATVKHLRKYETDSSHISCDNPQRMTPQGTSHPVCKELANAVDGKIVIGNSCGYSPLVDVHATSRNEVKLQNQANRIENLKKCTSSQNRKHVNTKIFVKVTDGNSLQLDTIYRNIKSHLNKSNQTKRETSECDTRNMSPQFVKRSHKFRSSPSEVSNLRQRMQLDITSPNSKVEFGYAEEKKTIQSGEIQYFEDKERNSDSGRAKRTFIPNRIPTHSPLDEFEIDCQNDDNNFKDGKDRVEVVETYKKANLSCSKDDGRYSPYETVTLRQRVQLDLTSRNKKVECVCVEENKAIQCAETQYFEDKERNSDTNGVKSTVFLSNYNVSDSPLGEYEIDCQNDENNYKDTKDRGEVVETYKEANLSCSKDDGRLASCSQLCNSDETKEGSCGFSKDRTILEFQSKEVPLETSKLINVGISEGALNPSNASSLQYRAGCSTSPIQVDMSNIGSEIEIVEDMGERLVNVNWEEIFRERDSLLDTYKCINNSVERSDSLENRLKDGRDAYFNFLVEAKPVIQEIEYALVDVFRRCQHNPLLLVRTSVEFTKHCFQSLRRKSRVMNNNLYHSFVMLYTNQTTSVFLGLAEAQLNSSNLQQGLSYLTDIRRTLVRVRIWLWGEDEELRSVFTAEKQVAKASGSKTRKKKRSPK